MIPVSLFIITMPPLNSVAPTCVVCASLAGKHWAPAPFPTSLWASRISAFRALMHFHRTRSQSKGNLSTFWRSSSQTHPILEWFQTPKLVLILKGYWIPNAMDPCGGIFPLRTWMEVTVGSRLRRVFGVWQLPDLCLLSLDQQGPGAEWQLQAKQQWLGCVSFGCVYSQPSCRQSGAMTLGEQELLFQVSTWCFPA